MRSLFGPSKPQETVKNSASGRGNLRSAANARPFAVNPVTPVSIFKDQPPASENDLSISGVDTVLKLIAEQACLATAATGAAIALAGDDEMICRATVGATAPALGARFDIHRGITGVCVSTQEIQRCDDALTDSRVDNATSRQLGVRSIVILPLLMQGKVVGIFELFSSRPRAFGDRDQQTLIALSSSVLQKLERAAAKDDPAVVPEMPAARIAETHVEKQVELRRIPPASAEPTKYEAAEIEAAKPEPAKIEAAKFEPIVEPPVTYSKAPLHPITAGDDPPVVEAAPSAAPRAVPYVYREPDFAMLAARPRRDVLGIVLSIAIVFCALLLVSFVAMHPTLRKTRPPRAAVPPQLDTSQSENSADSSSTSTSTTTYTAPQPSTPDEPAKNSVPPQAPVSRPATQSLPPGSLQVFEKGKEVYRFVPPGSATASSTSAMTTKPATVELAPDAIDRNLISRVEPIYPAEAVSLKIEGAVVLDVQIGTNGRVQAITPRSGDPLLTRAAVDAVRQWRFRPQQASGRPANADAQVSLSFMLPR